MMEAILESFFQDLTAEELMNFDGLAEAEKITGKSYKTDKDTESLGMLLVIKAGEEKRKKLAEAKDTNYNTTIEEFDEMLTQEGFEKIYEKEFSEEEEYRYHADENDRESEILSIPYDRKSRLYVYWHPELFILLYGTTYPRYERQGDEIVRTGETINSGNMRYTVKLKDDVERSDIRNAISSCSWINKHTMVGSHDIRDGFRGKLNALKKYFNFAKWEGRQSLWLLHYTQHRQGMPYDSDEINREVYALFPDHVKDGIGNHFYGAPLSLQDLREHIVDSYFDYETANQMSEEDQIKWFDENIDPEMDVQEFAENFEKDADNKYRLKQEFLKYKEFHRNGVVY